MSLLSDRDTYYMQLALQEARKALEEEEIPIGAIIVCEDRILARSHNRTERLHDVTAHAEMMAITAAADALGSKYLSQCELYVTLEPCVMCAGAIGWSQLKRLVYGASDTKRGFERLGRSMLHPKTEIVTGICSEESERIIKSFFQQRR